MNKAFVILTVASLSILPACKKKGCTDSTAINYDSEAEKDDGSCEYDHDHDHFDIPDTYVFTDAAGNNTVSFGGQTARMDMLSEMTSYLKTANTSGGSNQLDAATLLAMYDNSYTGWSDQNLVDNGKQLKSKTALGDAGIQAQFETWMTEAAAATPPTEDGYYLQAASGHEWTQLIEKGLMSACFASQMTANYLAGVTADDNTTAVDTAAGKYYTEMEHHWDEAYGYFTDQIDYDPNASTKRFWGKYAGGSREELLGTATALSEAFRTGRAAISADDMDTRDQQISVVREQMELAVGGTAIYYLNKAFNDLSSGAEAGTKNHHLAEAEAFIYGLMFGGEASFSKAEVEDMMNAMSDYNSLTGGDIHAVRDQIATGLNISDSHRDNL